MYECHNTCRSSDYCLSAGKGIFEKLSLAHLTLFIETLLEFCRFVKTGNGNAVIYENK